VRPAVVGGSSALGVVWEETDENHRGIHFQAVDANATPLGPSVEIADLDRGGAEPRVVVDGDGYAVLWTADQPETSVIAFRRIDARGKPRGDVAPAISAPSARALAVSHVGGGGFAVAWWSGATRPPVQAITWLDADGRPQGRPVELSHTTLVDPMADLRPDPDGGVRAAWEEQVSGVQHVMVGRVAKTKVVERVDVGPGTAPSLDEGGVMFARLEDASVWWSPLEVARPVKFTDGQYPDAAGRGGGRAVLCLMRQNNTDEASVDELDCLDVVRGVPVSDRQVFSAPRELVTLQVTPFGEGYGVVYQVKEADAMAVNVSIVMCH
jgi:hypothetical protein